MKTETLEVNGFKIELPIGLPEVLDTPVRDSYQTFLKDSTKDVRRHLTCASTLLPPLARGMDGAKVLHAFGGLGATAQILDQCAKDLTHTFWERDSVCLDHLTKKYLEPHEVWHMEDSFVQFPRENLIKYDILLLDMSVGTIKTKGVKKMWDHIYDTKWLRNNNFIWFTDTACHKIHLNYKSYEKDFGYPVEPNAESYLNLYSLWLEDRYGFTITAAMREAGEYYCVVRNINHGRFSSIPYV